MEGRLRGRRSGRTGASKAKEIEQRLAQYRDLLTGDLPQNADEWSERDALRSLVFQLLDFHRREAKPEWWSIFARMDKDETELIDDVECIAGLRLDPTSPPRDDKRSRIYTYMFPAQDCKLKAGDACLRCDNAQPAGAIVMLDEDARRLSLNCQQKTRRSPRSCPSALGGRSRATRSARRSFALRMR